MSKIDKSNTQNALLVALEKKLGIVTDACKEIGIARSTFYEWVKKDDEFAKKVDDISEVALDFAESKLFQKMGGIMVEKNTPNGLVVYEVPPSDTALIFYLKTKGKKRGYIERQEIDQKIVREKQFYVLPDGTKMEWE